MAQRSAARAFAYDVEKAVAPRGHVVIGGEYVIPLFMFNRCAQCSHTKQLACFVCSVKSAALRFLAQRQ